MPTPSTATASTLGFTPTASRIATHSHERDQMKDLAPRHASDLEANLRPPGQLSRRRLGVLLAATAGALAALAGCGEEEKLTRDGYSFPGAEKDDSGNFKMRGFR